MDSRKEYCNNITTLRRLAAALVFASLAHSAIAETLGEHPAVIVARTWSTRGIDPNTFIVLHPASPRFLAVSPTETDAQSAAVGTDLATPSARATASADDVAGATLARAQALLARAVDAVRTDPGKFLDAVNTLLGGPYAEHDLYVFVISISHKLVLANGADPRLIEPDTDALSLRAPGGKFVQELIAAAGQQNQAEMHYAWPNPVTGNVENKRVLLHKVDDMVVGVGGYAR